MFAPLMSAAKNIFLISSLLGSAQLATTSLCCRSLAPNLTSLTSCSRKPRQSGGGRRGLPSSTRASPSELQIRHIFVFGFCENYCFLCRALPTASPKKVDKKKVEISSESETSSSDDSEDELLLPRRCRAQVGSLC